MNDNILNHHMVCQDFSWDNFTADDHNTWRLLFNKQKNYYREEQLKKYLMV